MKKLNIYHLSSAILPIGLLLIMVASCKHEIPQPKNGIGSGDDGGSNVPCDTNVIYFQQEIQPLLISYCAMTGNNLSCHNSINAEDGVVLDNYSGVTAIVDTENFLLDESELWEMITESDPDDRMPPSDQPQLSQDQIDLIRDWILQGAQNLSCNEDLGPCDSLNVSFAANVWPIINAKCKSCHQSAYPGNGNVSLLNYNDIVTTALPGNRLMNSIRHTGPYDMPKAGNKLSDCSIAKIGKWVADGAPNN